MTMIYVLIALLFSIMLSLFAAIYTYHKIRRFKKDLELLSLVDKKSVNTSPPN